MTKADVHARLREIIERVAQLRKERDDLKRAYQQLQDEVEAKAREMENLQAQLEEKVKTIHILQTANSLNSREDKEEAKQKVDDLLREIEHCLKLLDS